MTLVLHDDLFDAQFVRALAYTRSGGAELGECVGTARRITKTDPELWYREWLATAERAEQSAVASSFAGDLPAARGAYLRASNYYRTAGLFLMGAPVDDRVRHSGAKQTETFRSGAALLAAPPEILEIPYEGTTLPGYFSAAPATDDGPPPVVVLVNGLDSTKEHQYSSGHWAELAARGISCLMLDQPGTGEALRLQHLPARIDTEAWAGAAVDWLLTRDDVDPARIGIVGWSVGGYFAPRAAAYEKRVALCVAWGANHNRGAVQRRRLEREGERPVPHYREHVLWVWGFEPGTDLSEFIAFADDVHLDGVVANITVPFLIAHGQNDRQIPLEYAHRSYEQATASPKRELRVFTPEEGATEHIGLDHLPHVSVFVADWVADTFAEMGTASR